MDSIIEFFYYIGIILCLSSLNTRPEAAVADAAMPVQQAVDTTAAPDTLLPKSILVDMPHYEVQAVRFEL